MQQRGHRILIVDDNDSVLKVLTAFFTMAGFDVRTASSGDEAVAIFESESFPVVMSDVRMPGRLNGHELVRWVRARCPKARCVLMSGYDDVPSEDCSGAAEPCSFLEKPFFPQKAIEVINALLREGRSVASAQSH